MRRHRGYSLVELLVILSAASTVLTVSVLLIHRTVQSASRTRAFHAEEATAWRLSSQLRRDAAGATEIDVERADEGVAASIRLATDYPIEYRFAGPQVERTQTLDGNRESRETFTLPSIGAWTIGAVANSTALQIEATPSRPSAPSLAPALIRVVIHAGAAEEALP